MLGIPKENIFELVDTNHAEMESVEEKLMDRIKAGSVKLSGPTGIGANERFRGGIQWKILRDNAFNLVEQGTIKVIENEDGVKRVDLSELK